MRRRSATIIGLLVIAACASTSLLLDKGPGTATLRVQIVDIDSTDGQIGVALFGSPEGFPSDHALAERSEILPVSGSSMEWVLEDVPTGSWAVAVLHDADADGEMATNWMGRPTEGWGVSNDARGSFGPPSSTLR